MTQTMFSTKNFRIFIKKRHDVDTEIIHGIDFSVVDKHILGIVGESGSGKTMTMRGLLGLLPEHGQLSADQWLIKDQKTEPGSCGNLKMAMIFQDPLTGLDPLRTIGYHLFEIIKRYHPQMSKKGLQKLSIKELEIVGIHQAKLRINQYPHELSGGMRQRVLIAMALLVNPDLLIADEPTTALDVTVQAQILSLLKQLQVNKSLTIIFISHDLNVVSSLADDIVVMHHGLIVESGTRDDIFNNPYHPYTKNLLAASNLVEKGQTLPVFKNVVEDPNSELHWISKTHRILGGIND